jgi:hypothetical protein
MKRPTALIAAFALVISARAPISTVADPNNEAATFELHIEVPNVSRSPSGDSVAVTGAGVFSVHPKSVTASGGFTHTDSEGTVVGSGTWTATDLLSFEFYGCGVVTFPDPDVPLPPNFCGGALKLRVVLTPSGTTLALPGVLTVFCIVGPQTPESHDEPAEEGITLVVPGLFNFNEIVRGMNIYIRTSS